MTGISKLAKSGNLVPKKSALFGMCGISSGISALLILNLYQKSRKTKIQIPTNPLDNKKTEGSDSKTLSKKQLDRTFLHQLMGILKILIPKWACPEVGYMGLISSMLIVRSLCDLWTIYLGTLLESAIIIGESSRFNTHLIQFALTMPLMSLTNALLKYSTRQLEIRFRSRLTTFIMKKYMYKLTFYKLNQSMRNVDQLITTDVEKFSTTLANLYSKLSKPILDIFIYVYGISRGVGASVPATMLGYMGIAAVLISRLRKPMANLTAMEQTLEGEYRFGNTRIITNSEEISFYKGGHRELDWILDSFKTLYTHLDNFTAFKFMSEFFENFIAKYIATVVGYYAVSRPFFTTGDEVKDRNSDDLQLRQETYYQSGRMLINLAQAIGNLVLNAKDLSRLAGYTTRVHNLMDTLKSLNKEEDERLEPEVELNGSNGIVKKCTGKSMSMSSSIGNGIGRYVIQDHVIRFENVPIVTPNGDVLLKGLSMEVKSGMNVLISGPNGCGKSSLFRILGELWPLHGGILTKPATKNLFYVPQKPYMPYGTFRDQIVYPDSIEDMKRKGISDQDLVKYLQLVDLDWMVLGTEVETNESITENFEEAWVEELSNCEDDGTTSKLNGILPKNSKSDPELVGDNVDSDPKEEERSTVGQRRSWDSVENWMDVLSGGQKQRLAMARLFYHKPQFAILDECTSAVSVDVEGAIYGYCRSEGITLFTVTHRKSLWAHHEYVLHMDGRGSYSFKTIDQSATQEFGS